MGWPGLNRFITRVNSLPKPVFRIGTSPTGLPVRSASDTIETLSAVTNIRSAATSSSA
jgi:hypothetical protein